MYTKQDIRDFLCGYCEHVTHLAVGHTSYYTYEKSLRWRQRHTDTARQQFRHFRNSFSQFLYAAKAMRKPKAYGPLMLTSIEGTNLNDNKPELTIHFHIALGNIPTAINTDELRFVFEECWLNAGLSGRSIWLEEAHKVAEADNRWLYYSTKEATLGNEETWDVDNTQIPMLALAKRT